MYDENSFPASKTDVLDPSFSVGGAMLCMVRSTVMNRDALFYRRPVGGSHSVQADRTHKTHQHVMTITAATTSMITIIPSRKTQNALDASDRCEMALSKRNTR